MNMESLFAPVGEILGNQAKTLFSLRRFLISDNKRILVTEIFTKNLVALILNDRRYSAPQKFR